MIDGFVPRDHWRDFEEFALRVVEIKVRDTVVYDSIHSWRTQDTKDEGVDGQIFVTMAGGELRITVEAKLRKDGKVALRDIASSIVNYLINYSDIHFVVTNVRFTKDAYRVADAINSRGVFAVNYIDCNLLCSYLDEHPDLEKCFPLLAENIREQMLKAPAQQSANKVDKRLHFSENVSIPYLPQTRHAALFEVLKAIRNGTPLIALRGPRGTDKSFVLEMCIRRLCDHLPVVHIDMQYIDSVRTFLLAFLKNILGLDIFEYLDLLTSKECDEAWAEASEIDDTRAQIVNALRKLLHSHQIGDVPSVENFFIREFLSEFCKTSKRTQVLILENLNLATPETSLGILNLIPQIAKCNYSIVIELSLNSPSSALSTGQQEWYNRIRQIESMRILGMSTKCIDLEDYSDDEAVDMFCHITGCPPDGFFVKQIMRQYGRNPAVLREVGAVIVKKHITTTSELWEVSAPGSKDALAEKLFSVISNAEQYGENTLRALRWCLHSLIIMYGRISSPLVAAIENRFLATGTAYAFEKTGLVYRSTHGWYIRNEAAKEVLQSIVLGWEKVPLIEFLTANKNLWDLPDLTFACVEADILHELSDQQYLSAAENAIKVCLNNGEGRIATQILQKCSDYTLCFTSDEGRLTHLNYSLQVLQMKHALGLSAMTEREKECLNILEQCSKLYLQSPSDKAAELLIRCNLMYNSLQRAQFHFSQGEINIDSCISLAKKHKLDDWGARAFAQKAVCVKEQGSHDKCFSVFRKGIRVYPHDNYLRSCYLANYAAHQAKNNLFLAIRCCTAALNAAIAYKDEELCCWLREDLIMYRLEMGECSIELKSEIQKCRNNADKYCFRSDISRTYNLEGVFHVINNDMNHAKLCFQNSIQCYDGAITDQQKFLFRSNLLAVLPCTDSESTFIFKQQLEWLQENYSWLNQKLLTRDNVSAETNYAAIISLLKTAQSIKNSTAFTSIQSWFSLPQIKELNYNQRIVPQELLDVRFLLAAQNIMILF